MFLRGIVAPSKICHWQTQNWAPAKLVAGKTGHFQNWASENYAACQRIFMITNDNEEFLVKASVIGITKPPPTEGA